MSYETTTNTTNPDGTTTVVSEFEIVPTPPAPYTRETYERTISAEGLTTAFKHKQFYSDGTLAYEHQMTYGADGYPLTDDLHTYNPDTTRNSWRHLDYHATPDDQGVRRVAVLHDSSHGDSNVIPPGGVGPVKSRNFTEFDNDGEYVKIERRDFADNPNNQWGDNLEALQRRRTISFRDTGDHWPFLHEEKTYYIDTQNQLQVNGYREYQYDSVGSQISSSSG